MNKKRKYFLASVIIDLSFTLGHSTAFSQDPFYKGKTIRFVVGFSAGGGFDTYTRAIARHIGKHIPGNPTTIVESMGGAGSLIAANYIYEHVKPDGLTIGNWIGGIILQQYLGVKGVMFDATKFEWIGAPIQINNVCVFTKTSSITSVDKWPLRRLLGAERPGSTTADIPRILMKYSKLPIQLIEGYKGVADVRLATQGGEIAGFRSSWEGAKSSWRNVMENKEAVVVIQAVPKPHPDHSNVPLASTLIPSEEGRELLKVIVQNIGGTINRPYSLPPGTPKERVRMLQKAFDATMKDPEFIAEANKAKLDLDPLSGEEIEKIVGEIKNLSPALIAKMKEVILPKE